MAYGIRANAGETIAGVTAQIENTFGVSIEIVQNPGPAGWPLVVIEGEREQVLSVLRQEWGYADPEASMELDEDQER